MPSFEYFYACNYTLNSTVVENIQYNYKSKRAQKVHPLACLNSISKNLECIKFFIDQQHNTDLYEHF